MDNNTTIKILIFFLVFGCSLFAQPKNDPGSASAFDSTFIDQRITENTSVLNQKLNVQDTSSLSHRIDALEQYLVTTAGQNLLADFDFRSGWSSNGFGGVIDSNTFTSNPTGGIIYQTQIKANTRYRLDIAGTTQCDSVQIQDALGNRLGSVTSSSFDTAFDFTTGSNTYFSLFGYGSGIADTTILTTLRLKEYSFSPIVHSQIEDVEGGQYHLTASEYAGLLALLTEATVDTIPIQFTFADLNGQVETREVLSEWKSLTNYDSATASITNGYYRTSLLDSWHSADSVISSDSIQVKVTASSSLSTAVNATLTVGAVSDIFTVTTRSIKKIYFSSSEGSDSNDGLDSANALESASLIETYTGVPAETQFLLKRNDAFTDTSQAPLDYPAGETRIINAPRSNITIADYGTGAKPIIDCGGLLTNGIFVNEDSVTLRNLKIVDQVQWDSTYPSHYTYRLLHIWEATDWLVDSVDFDAEAPGYIHRASNIYIGYNSDGGTFQNCIVENSFEHGIYFGVVDSITIQDNIFRNNMRAGIVENPTSDWNTGFIIRRNQFINNQWFVALRTYGLEDLQFYYNEIIFPTDSVSSLPGDDNFNESDKARTYGIGVSIPTSADMGMKNAKIHNNNFIMHVDANSDGAIQIVDAISYTGKELSAEIYNNLFYKIHPSGYFIKIYSYQASTTWDLDFHNNLYFQSDTTLSAEWVYRHITGTFYSWSSLSAWQDSLGGWLAIRTGTSVTTDDNAVYGNPLFTSFADDVTATGTNDFSLGVGSPALDAGSAHSITIDFVGNTVPDIGGTPDIGAYEKQ
jgi:parallel beta-helix repeat protein